MHEVLVNRLGGLSLPRKSVVRLTDRPDMTLDVYRGRKTTIQLKFLVEHDLTPGSQNCKIGSGRKSKMAAVTKNSKNNKINFSRTTGYFLLSFGMEYQ